MLEKIFELIDNLERRIGNKVNITMGSYIRPEDGRPCLRITAKWYIPEGTLEYNVVYPATDLKVASFFGESFLENQFVNQASDKYDSFMMENKPWQP